METSQNKPRAVRRAELVATFQPLVFHAMTNEEKRIQAKAVAILEWIGDTWGIAELIQVEDAIQNSNGQGGAMEMAQ